VAPALCRSLPALGREPRPTRILVWRCWSKPENP